MDRPSFCVYVSLRLFFLLIDIENAFRSEVCLSIGEHVEARRLLAAKGFVHRTAGRAPTLLVWKV